jgi:thimet oligopeptidase
LTARQQLRFLSLGNEGMMRIGFLLLVVLYEFGSYAAPPVTRADFEEAGKAFNSFVRFPKLLKTTDEIAQLARAAQATLKRAVSQIESLPPVDRSFSNVVIAWDHAQYEVARAISALNLVAYLNEQTELSKAALEAVLAINRDWNDLLLNRKMFDLFAAFREWPDLSQDERQLLEVNLSSFWFNSHEVETSLNNYEVKGLVDALEKEADRFATLNLKRDTLRFSEQELKGVPAEFLAQLKKSRGKYLIDLKQWIQFDTVIRFCEVEATRKKVWIGYSLGAPPEAAEALRTVVAARKRIAVRSGYRSWTALQLDGLSASPQLLNEQFRQFRSRSQKQFNSEKAELAELLEREPQIWDVAFAIQKKRDQVGVDETLVRQYFEYETVRDKLFQYLEHLFGLEIREIEGASEWEGAQVFGVYAARDQRPLGAFSLDAFPRKGKNTWYYVQGQSSAVLHPDGQQERPFVHLNLNFAPGANGTKTLLNFEEVYTFFHEMGHVLDFVLTDQKYYGLSPELTNSDLLEFPSTLLEQLAWEPEVIRFVAKHFETGSPMPEDLIIKLSGARRLMAAHRIRARMANSVMDLALHGSRTPQGVRAERSAYDTYFYGLPDGHSFAASFGYLVGYDGQYWTYLWAEALALEYLEKFRRAPEGAMDRSVGREFQKRFLMQGGRFGSQATIEANLGAPLDFCAALLRGIANDTP